MVSFRGSRAAGARSSSLMPGDVTVRIPPEMEDFMSRASTLVRSVGLLGVCGALVACSGAQWTNQKVAAGYQPARQLSVSVVASSGTRDDLQEAVDEFTSTLRSELKSKGIEASLSSSEGSASPGARLTIKEWEPGSRALRYFVGFGSGEGHMTIVVDVTGADGTSALQGEVRGWVNGGMWGGSSLDAPHEAAKAIAQVIATGKSSD